jgi:hypothetical protein
MPLYPMNLSEYFRPSRFTRWARRLSSLALCGLLCPLASAQTNEITETMPPPGTLAYHLATNADARAAGRLAGYADKVELVAPGSTRLANFADAEWSKKFWLAGVRGLSATPIGFSNVLGGQGLPTMVSPRHYLCATHMHPEGYLIAFLDTNNVVHWRKTLQRVDTGDDISVGILNHDLPPAVGFLPVLPENYTNYLSTTGTAAVQGIGMNQDMYLFSQPFTFTKGNFLSWDSRQSVPSGLSTNWNVTLRGGDSSNPEMLLIGNRLVLVSHNYFAGGGPNYARHIAVINQAMHGLSTNNRVASDYQLKEFSLTNWPQIN